MPAGMAQPIDFRVKSGLTSVVEQIDRMLASRRQVKSAPHRLHSRLVPL